MVAEFDGRIALVTGAARGIGRAVATRLAGEGARVVLADVDGDAARRTAGELPGGHGYGVACDVRDEAQVRAVVEGVVAEHGALHVAVANAGVADVCPLLEMDLAKWRAVLSVNLDGVFLTLRHAAPAIVASGGGSIVTMASVTANAGSMTSAHYSAAKAAVVNLTQSAALELRPHGVRVNAVLPGFVATDLVAGQRADIEARRGLPQGALDRVIELRQGRYGTPEEIAEAVLFLASDRASFCTGSGLVVDGGLDAALL